MSLCLVSPARRSSRFDLFRSVLRTNAEIIIIKKKTFWSICSAWSFNYRWNKINRNVTCCEDNRVIKPLICLINVKPGREETQVGHGRSAKRSVTLFIRDFRRATATLVTILHEIALFFSPPQLGLFSRVRAPNVGGNKPGAVKARRHF